MGGVRKKISQREAQRLRQRVRDLETLRANERKGWLSDWPGTSLGRVELGDGSIKGAVWAARRLGHPVIATLDGTVLVLFAAPK